MAAGVADGWLSGSDCAIKGGRADVYQLKGNGAYPSFCIGRKVSAARFADRRFADRRFVDRIHLMDGSRIPEQGSSLLPL